MDDYLMIHAVEKLRLTKLHPSCRCKICGGDSFPYDVLDFNKSCESPYYPVDMSMIPVIYRLCRECGFIFTDFFDDFSDDQWKQYIYNDNYIHVDPEYKVIRPCENASMLRCFLDRPKQTIIGLDYGGGNGATAALVRQEGWTYDSYDPFGYTDVLPERIGRYNFCSAIEVFEHSPDPSGSLRAILEKATTERLVVVISTLTTDGVVANETRLAWWYAAPRNGHVSLYSHKSLRALAKQYGLMCTILNSAPFFFTRGYDEREARMLVVKGKLRRRWQGLRHRLGIRKTATAVAEIC